jgi:transposase
VPEVVVPDNLRSGVSKACRYEPDINPTYQGMASHYGVAVLPARVRKPRDKAKAESGVLLVERWILARLRKRTFFSLAELNQAIAHLLTQLNDRPFKKLPGSRRELFEKLDQPALRPLPPDPYEYAEWRQARVNIDYHVEVGFHYYSVPHQLVGKRLDLRVTERTVECFHRGQRVASHLRSRQRGRHSTVADHMPRGHRQYLEWTPERLLRWAGKIGPAAQELAKLIMDSRPHPQQGFRAVLGIMRLAKTYGEQRLEDACRRALDIRAVSFKSVQSILKNGLDRKPLPRQPATSQPIDHQNIRGSLYYAQPKGHRHADSSGDGQAQRHEADRDGQGPAGTDGLVQRRLSIIRG